MGFFKIKFCVYVFLFIVGFILYYLSKFNFIFGNFNMVFDSKVYLWLGYLNLMDISEPSLGFSGMHLFPKVYIS